MSARRQWVISCDIVTRLWRTGGAAIPILCWAPLGRM